MVRLLRLLVFCCLGFTLVACPDSDLLGDGGTGTPTDSGDADLGLADTGIMDIEVVDEGRVDTGVEDTGSPDAGQPPGFAIQIAYSSGAPFVSGQSNTFELLLTDTSTSRRRLSPTFRSGPTPTGNQRDEFRGFVWRPDGEGIIYRAYDGNLPGTFYAPMDGFFAAPAVLVSSPNGVAGASFPVFANGFSSQNAHIFFTQSEVVGEGERLRTSNLALANPASVVVFGDASVAEFLAPSGSRIVFKTGGRSSEVQDLWLADVAAPAPDFGRTRLNSGAPIDKGRSATWSPAGDRVAYVTEVTATGRQELNIATVNGTQVGNRVLARSMMPGSGTATFGRGRMAFSADGNHLVFGDNPLSPDTNDVYLIDLSLPISQPFLTLSGTVAPGALGVLRFQWSPAGDTLVYASQREMDGTTDLYLADRTNPGVGYQINASLGANGRVTGERWLDDDTVFLEAGIFPSGARVANTRLFIADVRNPNSIVLTEIHPAVTDDQTIRAFQFAPGSGEFVFRVDDKVALTAEFWRAEIQNGTLAGPATFITPTSYRAQFCVAPDGRWALIAPLDVPDQPELYLYVPGGSPEFEKVSGPLAAGTEVLSCAFRP